MNKRLTSSLLLSSAFLSFGVLANVSPAWHIDELSSSTGYTTSGESQKSHHFGLVKHSNTCGSDELMVSWSSDSAEIWSLAGQTITMDAEFNGVAISLPLEVVAIKPMSGNTHEVVMGHVFANSELLDLMQHSDTVNVLIPASSDASRHFTSPADRFSLAGFNEARAKAMSRCNSKSS
ncbi:hypothetical protein [Zhongshania sp. BJYM1]|jgi:hypothetical protein|uniref:hypothetical protein n=1 Tax=Zhongshania aquatica TaxID=2965069 RepID=UPI0022B53D07|nr:hypothetical protein [Marortus sp. BJYM1]